MSRASFTSFAVFALLLAGSALLQGCTPDNAEASAASALPPPFARGVVDVEGGLVSVRPQRSAQLVEIDAALGQEVSRGAVLATLHGEAEHAEADAARADVARARAELSGARQTQTRLREQLDRVREAVELGAESAHVRDELQARLDAQTSTLPVAEAAVAAAEARMRVARSIADSTAIRAPINGRIVQVNARVGDVVSATDGPAMFLVRPNAALIVRASIPARDVSRVRVGSTATITEVDEATKEYRGQVLSIGELARKPDPSVSTDDFTSERVVDCVIRLDPNTTLRVGSLVMVSFR